MLYFFDFTYKTAVFSMFNIISLPYYSPGIESTWERMIKTIKSCLYKTIGRAKVNYFDLLTILSDIQLAINSRPLTYRCSSDSTLEIITPNCFLNNEGKSNLVINTNNKGILENGPPTQSDVVLSLKEREETIQKFKDLYYYEYLLSLRETCKDLYDVEFENKINVNDVVLVKNNLKPKIYWKLARVIKLFPGDDEKVRIAEVKLGNGSIQTHSIKHLFPIELSLTHSASPKESSDLLDDKKLSNLNLNKNILGSNSKFSNYNNNCLTNSTEYNNDVSSETTFAEHNSVKKNNSRSRRKTAGMRKHDSNYIYY